MNIGDWAEVTEDSLHFDCGDIVEIMENYAPCYLAIRKSDGKTGYVHKNRLAFVYQPNEALKRAAREHDKYIQFNSVFDRAVNSWGHVEIGDRDLNNTVFTGIKTEEGFRRLENLLNDMGYDWPEGAKECGNDYRRDSDTLCIEEGTIRSSDLSEPDKKEIDVSWMDSNAVSEPRKTGYYWVDLEGYWEPAEYISSDHGWRILGTGINITDEEDFNRIGGKVICDTSY